MTIIILLTTATTTFKRKYISMEYQKLELVNKGETNNKVDVTLNQCPDESRLDNSINGTTLNDFSLNATNRKSFGSINCRNLFLVVLLFTTLNLAQNAPLPPPTIIVFSITSNNPLHMVLGDSPYATTDISLGKSNWYNYDII